MTISILLSKMATLLLGAATASAFLLSADNENQLTLDSDFERDNGNGNMNYDAFPSPSSRKLKKKPTEVKCGDKFNNQTVVLTQDLVCSCDELYELYNNTNSSHYCELEYNNSNYSNTTKQCWPNIISMDGPDAVLDCRGHSIIGNDSCNFTINYNSYTKLNYFALGISLMNGAKAMNCHEQNAWWGGQIRNYGYIQDSSLMSNQGYGLNILGGGSVEGSDFAFNKNGGIVAQRRSGYADRQVTIVNSKSYNNSFSGLWVEAKDLVFGNKIIIENVEANYNLIGIQVGHASVHLKNVEASYNELRGVNIYGLPQYNTPVEFILDGKVILRNNGFGNSSFSAILNQGLLVDPAPAPNLTGTFTVRGDLIAQDNAGSGLLFNDTSNITVLVEKKGTITSCGNNKKYDGYDIENDSESDFFGKKYICNTTGGTGPGNFPVCKKSCSSLNASSKSGKALFKP